MLQNDLPFSERFLLYGDGGGGKTETAVNIASHVPGQFYVLESDYSAAWDRTIATRYPEVASRCEVTQVEDWEQFVAEFERVVEAGDPELDWVVIDSASPCTYEWVQEWVLDQIYGDDLTSILLNARKNAKDDKQFKGQKLELMNWDLVKKEYRKFWRLIQKWKGHMILTAEAKQIGYWDKDDNEAQKVYGTIGYYPAGQQTIRHAMATTLYLDHPRAGQWRMTTVKDRGREEQDKEMVDDFGLDYLVGVAGWKKRKMSKVERLAELGE